MICLVGKLPVLQVGRHQVAGYGTEWIDVALHRAARSCDRADFPFINDIRDGILHYLEHKCPWRVLPLEDLFERMKRMLRRIGCDAIANNLNPLAPPITLSIARAAREAGNGFELVFFQKLQKEIEAFRVDLKVPEDTRPLKRKPREKKPRTPKKKAASWAGHKDNELLEGPQHKDKAIKQESESKKLVNSITKMKGK